MKSTNNDPPRNRIDSRVYKGCLNNFNGVADYAIALKWINVRSHREIVGFKNEIEVLCQLSHPNLVSTFSP